MTFGARFIGLFLLHFVASEAPPITRLDPAPALVEHTQLRAPVARRRVPVCAVDGQPPKRRQGPAAEAAARSVRPLVGRARTGPVVRRLVLMERAAVGRGHAPLVVTPRVR